MSTESTDQSPALDPPIAAEPGAGLEAMRRRAHVAPPPPPVMPARAVAPTPLTPESPAAREEADAPRAQRRRTTPKPPTKADSTEDDQLLGQAKGNVRQISTRLPLPLRQKLVAISQREELTLGDVAMDAVRMHHQALREQHKPRDGDGHGFAPPRRRAKRSAVGEKVPTPMSVTPEEAEALQTLAEDVSMSVNRVVIECLEAAFESGLHQS